MGSPIADGRPLLLEATTPAAVQGAVKRAAEALLAGEIVAYPTESFYGLAADARNGAALRRLFRIKGRGPSRPILILVARRADVGAHAARVPEAARKLMDAFWPGGLTLVFEAGPDVQPGLTAGTGRIGIRVSSHPLAAALAEAAGIPITGTSANLSGRPACRTAAEVLLQLGDRLDVLLDGGTTPGEAASTILDVTSDPPRVLREGLVSRHRLEAVVPLQLGEG